MRYQYLTKQRVTFPSTAISSILNTLRGILGLPSLLFAYLCAITDLQSLHARNDACEVAVYSLRRRFLERLLVSSSVFSVALAVVGDFASPAAGALFSSSFSAGVVVPDGIALVGALKWSIPAFAAVVSFSSCFSAGVAVPDATALAGALRWSVLDPAAAVAAFILFSFLAGAEVMVSGLTALSGDDLGRGLLRAAISAAPGRAMGCW
jgi:hypothetical protein